MNTRTIYHIEFAKNGDIAASWGEVCMLENIKYFVSRWEKNCVLTTEKWKKTFLDWWLQESEFLVFKTIDTEDPSSRVKLLFNYFKRVFLAKKLIKNINFNDNDIIFCHSDFFPNSLPLYWISKINKNLKYFYYFHIKAPRFLYGFEGEFLNKKVFPNIFFIYFKLNQFLYLYIIKKINTWCVIWVNPYYKDYIESKFQNTDIKNYCLRVFWWVVLWENDSSMKKYDIAWMWRFQWLKGLDELFDVAKKLKEKRWNIKILVIGWWDIESEQVFIQRVLDLGLENDIDYKWFLNGKERFELISQARIFAMTSYFESYWLVNIEAMKLWLPVIAYDLPVFHVFKKWMIRVPILDNDKFSEKILFLLENQRELEKYSQEAKDFSKEYSWENTGKEIYNLF